MRLRAFAFAVVACLSTGSWSLASDRPEARELLALMDSARPPGQSMRIELSLTAHSAREISRRRYRLLDDGGDRTLVEFLDPVSAGQKVLATAEELWFISPSIHRAIRVPPAQRMFGDASYGDVARVRWSQDYEAAFDEPDSDLVNGEDCWRIRLTAKRSSATYRNILLWFHKESSTPVRAEFFTASGKRLKTAEFPDARIEAGRLVNNRWVLRTATIQDQFTVLEVEFAEPAQFAPGQFTRRYLELNP